MLFKKVLKVFKNSLRIIQEQERSLKSYWSVPEGSSWTVLVQMFLKFSRTGQELLLTVVKVLCIFILTSQVSQIYKICMLDISILLSKICMKHLAQRNSWIIHDGSLKSVSEKSLEILVHEMFITKYLWLDEELFMNFEMFNNNS